MRYIVLVLLLLAVQFTLTAFAPTPSGKGWILWPFSIGQKPILRSLGGLPRESGSIVTPILAGLAGLGFLAGAAGLFGILVPASYWPVIVIGASVASLLLQILYIGPLAILPILVDLGLLWGVLLQHWTVAGLRGG